jgi:hypothetical protein
MYTTQWAGRVNFGAAGAPFLHTVKAECLYVDFGNTACFNPPPAGFINRAGEVPFKSTFCASVSTTSFLRW